MRLVVVGDIGWRDLYHLGDEAMTERALGALAARGASDVTLVAGQPAHATARYGLPAVRRIGFRDAKHDRWNEQRRTKVIDAARRGAHRLDAGDPAREVLAAVRDADAVLVAGGGNLNGFFPQHLLERATICTVARELGKPYALTSQTIGPLLRGADRAHLRPLLGGAVAVGAREHTTAGLIGELTDEANVVRTVDDAFGLEPGPDDVAVANGLGTDRYIVASFAEQASTPLLGTKEYRRLAAAAARDLADLYDADVLLVPHAGTFVAGEERRDQVSNKQIAELAADPRVRATPMLTARQAAALTAGAALVVGTRYHPAILAARAGVPSIALAPTLYSSVRMRGAARHVGLEDYVLGVDSWRAGALLRAARELHQDDAGVREHLRTVGVTRLTEHEAWWDALVAGLRTGRRVEAPDLAPVPSYGSHGDWAVAAGHLLDATERFDRERMLRAWERADLEREVAALRASAEESRQRPRASRISAFARSSFARAATLVSPTSTGVASGATGSTTSR